MDDRQEALRRGLRYIGGKQVAPERYAWNRGEWRISSADAIADWIDRYGPPMGLEERLSRLEYVAMPSWWSPEDQFLFMGFDGRPADIGDEVARVLTADLKTGMEIDTHTGKEARTIPGYVSTNKNLNP